jgi:hypothetical protein
MPAHDVSDTSFSDRSALTHGGRVRGSDTGKEETRNASVNTVSGSGTSTRVLDLTSIIDGSSILAISHLLLQTDSLIHIRFRVY